MCASASAILAWNAIPVFADIDPLSFNLTSSTIEPCISPYTKAILAVDIFGQTCDIDDIMSLARAKDLKVITDTAQSPGSIYKNKKTGTSADIGGFSFNYHKHVHTGEGGILVTNSDEYCERMQLIRNHAEAVVKDKKVRNLSNLLGYNFRLGEIEAAIGIEQLKKLDSIISNRQYVASQLTKLLTKFDCVQTPYISNNATHSYYVYPIILDLEKLGISRKLLVSALRAEGLDGLMEGYANIHLLPMYQEKIAYGSNGFPWSSDVCKRDVSYELGICPNAEFLHSQSFIGFEMCLYEFKEQDLNKVLEAFDKVFENLNSLRNI